MMRVISGRFKGKKLLPVKNLKIRPTLDRSKEMIFNLDNLSDDDDLVSSILNNSN